MTKNDTSVTVQFDDESLGSKFGTAFPPEKVLPLNEYEDDEGVYNNHSIKFQDMVQME